jgi:hypothetical protein
MQTRQRQDDGYQYNVINPIRQKKCIIKSIAGVSDVVQALLTTAKLIFSHPVKYASISSRDRQFFYAELIKIALRRMHSKQWIEAFQLIIYCQRHVKCDI